MKSFLRYFGFGGAMVFASVAPAAVNSPTTWTQVVLSSNPQTVTVPFVFAAPGDLLVLDSQASPPNVLTLNSDYTVSGGAGSTGTIATIAGGAHGVLVGDTITISRSVPLTQTTNFTNTGPLTAAMIGNALDKLTTITQQLNLVGANSLQFQGDEVINGVMAKTLRAGNLLGFDATGQVKYYPPSTNTGGGGSVTGWVRPETYGAVGNGVADDTAAISTALTAAGLNGFVFFTPGSSYKMTSELTIPYDGQTLWGYGAIITSDTQDHFQKFKFSSRTAGRVLGLTFNCLYVSTTTGLDKGVVEVVNSTGVAVRDCVFNDIAYEGVFVSGLTTGTLIEKNLFYDTFCAVFSDDDGTNQPVETRIIGNRVIAGIGTPSTAYSGAFKFSGHGSANSHAGHVIANNVMDLPGQMGVELQTWVNDCSITGNTIYGSGFGVSIDNSNGCTVANNAIRGTSGANGYGIEIVSGATGTACVGNVLDGANTAGSLVGAIGYSINASNNTTIQGGTVRNYTVAVYAQDASGVPTGLVVSGMSLFGAITSGDIVRLKDVTGYTISDCDFNAGSTLAYDFICWDTTDGPITNGIVSHNRFRGTTSNSGFQFYIPGTNAIQYLQVQGNDSTAATVPAWHNVSAGNAQYLVSLRYKDNTCPGSPSTQNINTYVFATTGNHTLATDSYYQFEGGVILVDATSGGRSITLPDSSKLFGYQTTVAKADSSGNAVTIGTTSSQNVYGGNATGGYVSGTTYALGAQGNRVTVESDGANWLIIQAR